jgi:UDP-N-acetylmuramate dehydrogenase
VGASPIQNIGAYGVELKDVFEELEAIEWQTGKKQRFTSGDCHFGYRHSIFKNKDITGNFYLSKIYFKLTKGHHQVNTSYGAIQELLDKWQITNPQPPDVAAAVIEIRRSKLPDWRQLGNAGSFFKNPVVNRSFFNKLRDVYPQAPSYPVDEQSVKIPAGWLIDQCGWKGKRIGNVGCYSEQALVIVNYGGASGQEVLSFGEQVAASVLDRFGVVLEREVNWV